jgi:hypothetical protein
MSVPALRVNPPAYVPPAKARVPAPLLMNPVPTVVDIACEPRLKTDPTPISRVLTAPLVANVLPMDAKLTLTLFARVIFPTFTTAPIPANE